MTPESPHRNDAEMTRFLSKCVCMTFVGLLSICLIPGATLLSATLSASSIINGYEDAVCIAVKGTGRIQKYCQDSNHESVKCTQYMPCCDFPVALNSSGSSTIAQRNTIMRGRACLASDPCATFYDWLSTDPMTINQTFGAKNSSLTFPCKVSAANFDYSPESLEALDPHCGSVANSFNGFTVSVGPLSNAANVWCGVTSTNAEYPTFLSFVTSLQRLQPLYIALTAIGAVALAWLLWFGISFLYKYCTRERPRPPSDPVAPPAANPTLLPLQAVHAEEASSANIDPKAPAPLKPTNPISYEQARV
jgi:hypothetical protein